VDKHDEKVLVWDLAKASMLLLLCKKFTVKSKYPWIGVANGSRCWGP
jgi:hypothetical protein